MGKLTLAFGVLFLTLNAFGFGYSGSDGSDGRRGQNGVSGDDVTIYADGSTQYYDLNGTNAGPGADGQNGGHASSCYQPTPRSDVYGADGGDGGDGGSAGTPGRGGDALVFYSTASELSAIMIEAQGGYGNYGGRGSYGGSGCACSTYSWSHRICSTTQSCTTRRVCEPDDDDDNGRGNGRGGVGRGNGNGNGRGGNGRGGRGRRGSGGRGNEKSIAAQNCRDVRTCTPVTTCSNVSYRCFDGDNGRDGRSGSNSSDARMGTLRLVKGLDALPSQSPHGSSDLARLETTPISLSKRIWANKSGAKALFAAGSIIRNEYQEFVRLSKKDIVLKWSAPVSIANFSKNRLEASFDGYNTSYKLVGEDFLEHKSYDQGDKLVVEVTRAFKKDQMSDLKIKSLTGTESNVKLEIEDKALMSEIVKTKIKLTLKSKRWLLGNKTAFEGYVPSSAMTIVEDKITIHIGKLDMDMKWLKRKRKVEVNLVIERSFAGKSDVSNLSHGPVKL